MEEFDLQKSFLNKLKEEKEKRKRRRLLDRGFKPPQPADEETGEIPPDPEIEEDPDDFDKAAHEREVMRAIFADVHSHAKGLIIDGTWANLPEDTVSQSL